MRPAQVDPEWTPVTICTTIPYKAHLKCKQNGWKWSDVFMTGYNLRCSDGDEKIRIQALEQQVERLKEAMRTMEKDRAKKRFGMF